MFQLTFLGTSAGIPSKSRNVSALAIECVNPYARHSKRQLFQRPWVLVDCGEGTQQQLLHTRLSLQQLALICITHVHGDHCYGLPGLLASMAMSNRQQPLTLIAPKAIRTLLDTLISTTELQLNFAINFLPAEDLLVGENNVSLELSATHQLTIELTALSHRVPSYAFSLTQRVEKRGLDKQTLQKMGIMPGPIWGALQAGKTVTLSSVQATKYGVRVLKPADFMVVAQQTYKLVVAGDNDTPELLRQALAGAQLLVHEATYTHEVKTRIRQQRQQQLSEQPLETQSETQPEMQNERKDKKPPEKSSLKSSQKSAQTQDEKQSKNGQQWFDPMHTSAQEIAQFAEEIGLEHLILTHFSARYQPFDRANSSVSNMADIRLEVERNYHGKCWLARDFAQFSVDDSVTALGVCNNAHARRKNPSQ